jgi:acetoin utilization deacetylase AcuC-like enzyme
MYNRMVPMFEKPERMEHILARIRECAFGQLIEPDNYNLEAVHRVHDPDYVKFLQSAHARWEKETDIGGFATAYV